jgi:hypothetical protein
VKGKGCIFIRLELPSERKEGRGGGERMGGEAIKELAREEFALLTGC